MSCFSKVACSMETGVWVMSSFNYHHLIYNIQVGLPSFAWDFIVSYVSMSLPYISLSLPSISPLCLSISSLYLYISLLCPSISLSFPFISLFPDKKFPALDPSLATAHLYSRLILTKLLFN